MLRKIVLSGMMLLLFGCGKEESPKEINNDFESLMGKDFPAWQHVQTKADFENLNYFKSVYEKNSPYLEESAGDFRIPKVIHYIWIGPKPFPRESVEWVRTWIAKHPTWQFILWTDRERPLPQSGMQIKMIQDFPWKYLKDCYNKSDNFGEKSDVLRYEILYQFGGIFVDHDVKCVKSFDSLNQRYDLFCGMEMPYPTALDSCVLPTNNLIGSKPGHPVLKETIDWLLSRWDNVERDYPGKDRDAVINRVTHRTFLAFGEAFKAASNEMGNRDIAFPTMYFNAPKDDYAILCRHLYQGTWFENESGFEKLVRERLMKLSKKSNQLLLFCCALGTLNVAGIGALFLFMKRKSKSQ